MSTSAFRWRKARPESDSPRPREIATRLSYCQGALCYMPWQITLQPADITQRQFDPRATLAFLVAARPAMAGFKPQANLPSVRAYLAKEQGFFEQNGLDVTIEHSAGRGEHVQLLVAGKVQMTTMDSATILQRRADPGLPVISIALIGQKGWQAFAALASSGARKDWEGKTVGYRGIPPPDLYVLLSSRYQQDDLGQRWI